jgi:hypothetical protein
MVGRRIVVFDLHTGVPVEPRIVFGACSDCTAANVVAVFTSTDDLTTSHSVQGHLVVAPLRLVECKFLARQARAPPVG